MSVEAILEDPRFMCKRGKTCPLIEPALKDKMETQGSIDPTDMVYEQYGYCKEHGYPPEFASDVEDADAQWAEDYGDLPALSKLFRLNPTIADGMKERAAEIFKTEEE